ncbi:MAG: flagellar protein FlgN [Clostridium sp.]|uniref:flagellar protein FlgN n=1 Tax=Clostridium sp. TaxID=1506 RepID=UPI00302D04D3
MKNQLRSILEEELATIDALVDVLEFQHELLVNQDVFKLEGIVKDIDDCSRNLARSEGRRRGLIGQNSIKIILETLGDDELNEVYSKITNSLNNLIIQKESNELLIKQSLSYTNSMLAMVGPKQEVATYNGYGKVKR